MTGDRSRQLRGFTLIELLLVVAIIALLISILIPALSGARRVARTGVCMSNMRSLGVGVMNYASDERGSISAFNWQPRKNYSTSNDLNNATSFVSASANQAVDIIRRQLGRDAAQQPTFDDRLINRNYWHLVMFDAGYFAERMPEPGVICPEDKDPLVWQRNVDNPMAGLQATGDPDPDSSGPYKRLMPFWTTYQMAPNCWSPETGQNLMAQTVSSVAGSHLLYNVSSQTKFEARRMDVVAFPSQKVLAFDLFDRHQFKRSIFHAYAQARQPLLFFDGQVTMRKTGDANPGWNTTTPASLSPTLYYYAPTPYEPRTLSGASIEQVKGYYRWTRNGLKGIDYGGKPSP